MSRRNEYINQSSLETKQRTGFIDLTPKALFSGLGGVKCPQLYYRILSFRNLDNANLERKSYIMNVSKNHKSNDDINRPTNSDKDATPYAHVVSVSCVCHFCLKLKLHACRCSADR